MHVRKQSENGTNSVVWKEDYPYPEKFLDQIEPATANSYPLLRDIAPYENTYFNSQQTKSLIGELEHLKMAITDSEDKKALEGLIEFARTVELQEHLVFIGD